MKNLKLNFAAILMIFTIAVALPSCGDSAPKKESEPEEVITPTETRNPGEIYVYYFHAKRRCETCKVVEQITKDAIIEHFGDKVVFKSIDTEDRANTALMEDFSIDGQTLLFIKDTEIIDLTVDAFFNAHDHPEKLNQLIKSTIEQLM